jgi:hypothetical protein
MVLSKSVEIWRALLALVDAYLIYQREDTECFDRIYKMGQYIKAQAESPTDNLATF